MLYGMSVLSPLNVHNFRIRAHERLSYSELALDPHTFYWNFSRTVPTIPHFEIEVLSPSLPMLIECGVPVVRQDNSDNYFIAYPNPVPSFTKMWEVFTHWCIMGTMILDGGFIPEELIVADNEHDSNSLLAITRKKYGIRVCAHSLS